jgi:hypothetical protein
MKHFFLLPALLFLSPTILFSQGCLPEGITFTTQEQIDNFQANYPGCTEIEGDVLVGSWSGNINYNIQNLVGLNNIIKVDGRFEIVGCHAIGDLSGLNSLTQVDDYLIIYYCAELDNLSGLNSLSHVGGGFVIALNNFLTNIQALESLNAIGYGLWIEYNWSLDSLTGFDNLISVDSSINIDHNDNLVDISALKNINANSIHNYLIVRYNNSLSDCAIQSICDYIENPNGLVLINNNSEGCNSPEEVEAACLSGVEENITSDKITLYRNPANSFITITIPGDLFIEEAIIYNHLGQKTLMAVPVNSTVDVSTLKSGIYFLEVITNKNRAGTKLVIG